MKNLIFHLSRIALVLLLVSALTPAAQKREASKEVRGKLFKQVMADYAELRDCVTKEEGGARAAEEGTTVEEVDLNRDGVAEYEVQLSSPCVCGMVNCTIYLYREHAGRYEALLEGAAGLGVELLKTSSNGYVDLLIEARETAATRSETTYKFDGKQYRETGATIVHQETGERKPASRRVQFKRGASSATVQGKVSIAMHDKYIVGARAGQVMTLNLTAPRSVVRFMLVSPNTGDLIADSARNWTGTLPQTGDYQIIVDADERGGTYSMTITIR